MYYRSPHRPLLADQPRVSGPTSQSTSKYASHTKMTSKDWALPTRRIAVPADDSPPSFDNVFSLALTSALFDQAVLVICMTEEILTDWRRRLQERARPVDGLALVDGRFGWSADWRAFFHTRSDDVTVLHGIHSALADQSIPRSYADRLVNAVTSDLIILA